MNMEIRLGYRSPHMEQPKWRYMGWYEDTPEMRKETHVCKSIYDEAGFETKVEIRSVTEPREIEL